MTDVNDDLDRYMREWARNAEQQLLDQMGHLKGHPVSARTYRYYGCRCAACRAAATKAQRDSRHARDGALMKVDSYARNHAAAYVRAHMPALWEKFLAEAYEHYGLERRGRGRPRKGSDDAT